ncbi:ABC transporter permease [Chitinophaga sp. GCM10012297]|uniref:ABC transporter permease n=1 Tax=Chitinophaga chungangae TaxID=2821488 RepID=A0ABS3YDC7_9BACT|nr:ABC transporter permease [Chitinophaga chungangae]MBO9152685.1 ABC transporter permease [Chitinophaga chungangae]
MLRNIKVAFRTLFSQKLYAFIIIVGLGIGLAISTLLLSWVQDERSFDSFHAKAKDIYRVNSHFLSGAKIQNWSSSQAAVAPHAKDAVPGVIDAVRVSAIWGDMKKFEANGNTFYEKEETAAYVDPSFFTMFDFPIRKGSVFPDVNSVVLTESYAGKYFGKEDPLGKVITVDNKKQYTVCGTIADMPRTSTIQYSMLFPIKSLNGMYSGKGDWKSMDADWGSFYVVTYLQLKPGTDTAKTNKLLSEQWIKGSTKETIPHRGYTVQPLPDTHLYEISGEEGLMKVVRIFFIVAIVILLIAGINYVNLATARAHQRAVEISVRKLIGANRWQLFHQFMTESAVVFVLAAILSVIVMWILLPFYNDLTEKTTGFAEISGQILLTLAISSVIMLLMAAVYPALRLMRFNPIQSLKGRTAMSGGMFRKMLVVTQFFISIVLIGCTIAIGMQLKYINNKPLGFNRDNVILFEARNMYDHIEAAKDRLGDIPGVKAVFSGNADLATLNNGTSDTDWDGREENMSLNIKFMSVDADFMPAMQMEMKEGRMFRPGKADSASYILNEAAIRVIGMKDPIGKRFKLKNTDGIIVGVVKDFHISSMHNKIPPVVLTYRPRGWMVNVRTSGENTPATLAAIEKIWKEYNPEYRFEHTFMQDSFTKIYSEETRTGKLFTWFAGVAVFLSCLGLFGLATFTIHQRTKEIGIRKVLGASVTGIVQLITKDFVKLVIIAILLATPLSWYATEQWLQGYEYRTIIPFWVFLLAGGVAVLVAVFTIGTQSVKAALMNPVRTLKTE